MHKVVLLVVVATSVFVSGCGDEEHDIAAKLSVEVTDPGASQVRIGAPTTVQAGVVKIDFTNSGSQPHEIQLARVLGTHSQEEIVQVVSDHLAAIPDWLLVEGGVGVTSPGRSRSATVKLEPGNYYIFDAQSGDGNSSFAEQGGIRPLSVSGDVTGRVETVGALITAEDYKFTVPPLRAGEAEITFDNIGAQPHLLVAAPMSPGNTIDDVRAALSRQEAPPASAPPVIDLTKVTTVSALEGGTTLSTTISLEKGNYAFICFLTDRGGGPAHFTLGMLQESAVT